MSYLLHILRRFRAFLPGHQAVTNPSFERDTAGYAFDLGGVRVVGDAVDGVACCEVAVATVVNNFSSGFSNAPSAALGAAGEVWDGMLWAKGGSEGQDLYIRFRDAVNATLATPQMSATGRTRGRWRQFATMGNVAPANTNNLIVLGFNQSASEPMRIDAVQLRRR